MEGVMIVRWFLFLVSVLTVACASPPSNPASYAFQLEAINSDGIEARALENCTWKVIAGSCKGPTDCAVVIDDHGVRPVPLALIPEIFGVDRAGIVVTRLGTPGTARLECWAESCVFEVVSTDGTEQRVSLAAGQFTDQVSVTRVAVHVQN